MRLASSPGANAAPVEQRDRLYAGSSRCAHGSRPRISTTLSCFTSEHWTNFFLDHISPFCIGRADATWGPWNPGSRSRSTEITGDPELAGELLEHCYDTASSRGSRTRWSSTTARWCRCTSWRRDEPADRAGHVQHAGGAAAVGAALPRARSRRSARSRRRSRGGSVSSQRAACRTIRASATTVSSTPSSTASSSPPCRPANGERLSAIPARVRRRAPARSSCWWVALAGALGGRRARSWPTKRSAVGHRGRADEFHARARRVGLFSR